MPDGQRFITEAFPNNLINYSEFSTLAQCERKWAYAYVLNQEEEGAKRGLHLGTLCHLWHGRWLVGKGATLPEVWSDDINTGGKPGEVRSLSLSDFEPELVQRALWLAGRFESHYGSQPPSHWNVISAEQWIARKFSWGTLVGRTDGFVEIDGQLWLIEVKSYGAKPGPLAYAMVSPQLGCYSLLAEEAFGKIPFGILYQGIHTYQWKRDTLSLTQIENDIIDHGGHGAPVYHTKKELRAVAKEIQPHTLKPERDPAESFEQLEVELGPEHLRTAEKYLAAAVWRRAGLTNHQLPPLRERLPYETLDLAVPNVGRDCSWCGFRDRCWNDLGGVEPFEIQVEDEGDLK